MIKQYKLSIVVVLIVGLLALVPNANATGYMDGANWTGINSIKNQAGNSFILNSTFLCGANTTCTYHANGSVSISAVGGSVTGMANPATADFNVAGYNITNATNVSAKNIGGVIYADQYLTIQDAINNNCPNCEVIIKAGTYMTTNISLPSDTTLRCLGNVTLKNSDTSKQLIRNTDWQNGNNNINIYGCIFDGMNSSTTYVGGFGGIKNSKIMRNTFKNASFIVIDIGRQSGTGNTVFFNETYNAPNDPLNVIFSQNIVMDGNDRYYDMMGGGFSKNVEVSENTFINGGSCFNILAGWKGKIHHNTFYNCNEAIRNEAGRDMQITDNNIYNSTIYGIRITSDMTGIDTTGYNHVGVENLLGSEGVIITGNHVTDTLQQYGIYVINAYDAIISDNFVNSSGYNGIYVHSVKFSTINNNIVKNWANSGINTGGIGLDTAFVTWESKKTSVNGNILINESIPTTSTGISVLNSGLNSPGVYHIDESNIFWNLTTNISKGWASANMNSYFFGNSATAPTAFGVGDTYFDTALDVPRFYNTTGWVSFGTGGTSTCTDCPNATVAANLANWNATYNATYDAKMSNPATADFNADSYSILNVTNYTTSQGRHLENGGCDASYCIRYNLTDPTIIEAINGSTGIVDFSETDGILLLQNAINQTNVNGGGIVFLKNVVISTSSSVSTLLIKQNVSLVGENKYISIIKRGNNIQTTIIEMESDSSIYNIGVDGNNINNMAGNGSWSSINDEDTPFAQGIYTSKRLTNGGVYLSQNNITVENVKIYDGLRTNIVLTGTNNIARNIISTNSMLDHMVYISVCTSCILDTVYVSGYANDEVVTIGNSVNSQIKNIYVSGLVNGSLWGRYPTTALIDRSTNINTNLDGIYVTDNDSVNGTHVLLHGESSNTQDLYITATGKQSSIVEIKNNGTLKDFNINVTRDDTTESQYVIKAVSNARVLDGTISAVGNWRSIGIIPGKAINYAIFENIVINQANAVAFRLYGDVYPIIYGSKNLVFLNGTTWQTSGTVSSLWGYEFGNSATPPTSTGFGDEYSNSTSGLKYLANLTSIFNPYMTLNKFTAGANITLVMNSTDGTLMINSTGASGCTDCPNVTVAAMSGAWNKTSLPFTIENGTNVIGSDYSNFFTTGFAGTLTKLISHSTQSGSINVSFWNASNSNSYIDSVAIAAGTDASTVLSYPFADETRIMFNITGAVTDIKQVGLTVKATKS